MSDTAKPKRPRMIQALPRSRPPGRDARIEPGSAPDEARRGRTPSRPRVEPVAARIGVVEAELARLREERGAEADQLAQMLVRIADAERSRTAAEERTETLAMRVRELDTRCEEAQRELDASREDVQRATELTEQAARRAGLAEKSASDGAVALERAHAELEADRARVNDVEARLARVRREHTDELASQRTGHAETCQKIARVLEEERAAGVRTHQWVAALEADLARAHDQIGRAAALVEQLQRREEMAAALRAQSLEQTRRALAAESSEPPPSPGTGDGEALDFSDV